MVNEEEATENTKSTRITIPGYIVPLYTLMVHRNWSLHSTHLIDGRKIPEGQSNSLVENKLTTPWLKMKKTNNSKHYTTQKTKDV